MRYWNGHRVRKLLSGCFFIFFTWVAHAGVSVTDKKAELNYIASQIQRLQATLMLDQKQQQQAEQALEATEKSIGELDKQILQMGQLVTKKQHRLTLLKREQQTVQALLSRQQNELSKQVRAIYQLGQLHPLKVILNQDNPNAIQRHLNYYRSLTEAQVKLIQASQQSLTRLNQIVADIARFQNNLNKLLAEKKEQQADHRQALEQRQRLLTLLHQHVQTNQQQLVTLQSNQKRLQAIITHLNQTTEQGVIGRPFAELQGKLQWPVNGPMMANYGSRLDVGDQLLSGVIIKTTSGAPVHAVSSGKVIFANWLRGFGLLVIINHDNHYMSLYGRNHSLAVRVGDKVRTGEVIASSGNSGGFEKASLYFEIRKNGSPINPNLWCR